MRALFYFLPLFRRLLAPMLLALLLSLITLAAGIGLLGISGWFLTAAALSTAGAAFNLFAPSAGVRGLSFIRILARYGEKLTGHDATLKLLSDLRRFMFERLLKLVPLGLRFGRADLVGRLIADLDALDTMFLVALGPIATAALVGVAMTTLLAFLLPQAAVLYAVSFASAALVVPVALVVASRRTSGEAAAASADLRRAILDGIDGHLDLVVLGCTDRVIAQFGREAERLAAARRRLTMIGSLGSAAVQMLTGAMLIGTLVVGLDALRRGAVDGPVLIGLLLAIVASFEASAALVRSATRLAGSAVAAERLMAIAEVSPAVAEPARPVPLPPGGEIAFDAVSFGYDPRSPVLKDLTVSIHTGEHVAIRGPSGSGKSTLGQLLLRLIEPQSGTIRINGCDIASIGLADLRRHVALMTQDAPVFADTVRANLLIGRPDATDDKLWQMLTRVKLADAVRGMSHGLDSYLGEVGRTLSAGQARRLCLARTLLSSASILVLDEPTSGLDRETELSLLQDMSELAIGRTLVVITHADVPPVFARVLTLQAGVLDVDRGGIAAVPQSTGQPAPDAYLMRNT